MTTTSQPPQLSTTVQLSPSFTLPVILVLGALILMFIQPVVGAVIALFGLFLMIQAVLIKLKFTPVTLEVYRGDKLIKSFPYQEWQNWQIFWQPVPILFYFKEVNSIHFLPIIFDPKILKDCLEKCFPKSN